jgi:hypothetical protein
MTRLSPGYFVSGNALCRHSIVIAEMMSVLPVTALISFGQQFYFSFCRLPTKMSK